MIPEAARSKMWVCGSSPTAIVGTDSAGGMDVCLLRVFGVVRHKSLCQAGHSSRAVLPSVECLSVIVKP
jgi:hypothetical protein